MTCRAMSALFPLISKRDLWSCTQTVTMFSLVVIINKEVKTVCGYYPWLRESISGPL